MELSLPAGNLQCAITAYENGADSVYFGMKSFSARKEAENFSFDDLCRIKEYAIKHNKKFYVALNTVVEDKDLDEVYKILSRLDFIGIDGLIVQDWGIVNICKKHFPSIPLHASTQMAVYDEAGVKALEALSFKRVVLARELSLSEIKEIRKACPNVELKVFIHGALCYSLSGQCYASLRITGTRSANCGSCAQICRWKFKDENGNDKAHFSLSDLESTKEIITALKEIGIDSLKVEGRLKGSLYVKEATRYYRALIDNSLSSLEDTHDNLRTAFSRKTSEGYFYKDLKNIKKELENKDYTGHIGIKVGTFITKDTVVLSKQIKSHDGLLYFNRNNEAEKLASTVKFKKKGEKLTIPGANAELNSALYKIKDGDENEKSFNPLSYPLYLKPTSLNIVIESDKLRINEEEFSLNIEEAKQPQDLYKNISEVFNTRVGLVTKGEVKITNKTSLPLSNVYIPLSILKKIKKIFYENTNVKVNKYLDRQFSTESKVEPHLSKSEENFVINNPSELHKALSDKSIENISLSPLLNIANREAIAFFEGLLEERLSSVYSWLESLPSSLNGLVLDGTALKDELPIFTSLSPLPPEGLYTTTYNTKRIKLKVVHEKGYSKTFLL